MASQLMGPKPKPDDERESDSVMNRVNFRLPKDIYDPLMNLAAELDFKWAGRYSVVTFLEAISAIEPDDMYNLLQERNLLPRNGVDRLWQ